MSDRVTLPLGDAIKPAVYVIRDEAGEVLYIGYSTNFIGRLDYHSNNAPFRTQMHSAEVIRCADAGEARTLERSLIRAHQPPYNKHHGPAPRATTSDPLGFKKLVGPGSPYATECGQRLRACRTLRGWTLSDVAESVAVTPQYIQMVEKGRRTPADHIRVALAFLFECEVSDLWPQPEYVEPAA